MNPSLWIAGRRALIPSRLENGWSTDTLACRQFWMSQSFFIFSRNLPLPGALNYLEQSRMVAHPTDGTQQCNSRQRPASPPASIRFPTESLPTSGPR